MNKLVLIGNGFDLAHGLKTRYNDFILWYLNDVVKKLRKNLSYSDDLVEGNKGLLFDAPLEFKSIKEFKGTLKKYGHNNFRYKNDFFRSLINKLGEVNWVDIESEYYSSLTNFYRMLETGSFAKTPEVYKQVKELNECLYAIKDKLEEYLRIVDHTMKIHNPEIAKLFQNEFGAESLKNGERVLFLNFNYTSTLEMYSDVLNHNEYSINYIHGKLKDNNNPLIFGYGDEMDEYYQKIERLNSNEFLNNIKSFGYFKTNNYQILSRFITDRYNVFIIGHSCGVSDRILLNSIVETEKCNSIKIYYHDKGGIENDYFEKTQELSRHFRPAFKGIMRNKIISFKDSVPLVKSN